ncbi:Binding partner of ACD11 1, partial [Bienertia sinuspersici]
VIDLKDAEISEAENILSPLVNKEDPLIWPLEVELSTGDKKPLPSHQISHVRPIWDKVRRRGLEDIALVCTYILPPPWLKSSLSDDEFPSRVVALIHSQHDDAAFDPLPIFGVAMPLNYAAFVDSLFFVAAQIGARVNGVSVDGKVNVVIFFAAIDGLIGGEGEGTEQGREGNEVAILHYTTYNIAIFQTAVSGYIRSLQTEWGSRNMVWNEQGCMYIILKFHLSILCLCYVIDIILLLCLCQGATIADKTVTIMLDPDYELPPAALAPPAVRKMLAIFNFSAQAALRKAEDAVTSMLAKGFILGKDAVARQKP